MRRYYGALVISLVAFLVGFLVGQLVLDGSHKVLQYYEFDSEVIVVDTGR